MNEETSISTSPPVRQRRPKATREEIAEWAKRFAESGLGQREFCRHHSLTLMTLQRWLARAESYGVGGVIVPKPEGGLVVPKPAQFTEIKLTAPVRAAENSCRWAAELCRPNGCTVRVAHDVPTSLLEQLLRIC
jgi:hypothetical protein